MSEPALSTSPSASSLGPPNSPPTSPTAIEPAESIVLGMAQSSGPESTLPKHKREEEFRSLFDLPHETLIDDFSCALQLKSLLLHGRLYIGVTTICFYSNILGRKTTKIIKLEQLIGLYKKYTAVVFPNAIEFVTLTHKYFFCSFMFRDTAFKLASSTWTDYLEASPSSETHRIITNVKFDAVELFVRRGSTEEQVRMLKPDDDDEESGEANEKPNEDTPSSCEKKKHKSSKKDMLTDSGSSIPTKSPEGSSSNLLGSPMDSSDDVNDNHEDKKSKKQRKRATSKSKKDITGIKASVDSPIQEADEDSAQNSAQNSGATNKKDVNSPSLSAAKPAPSLSAAKPTPSQSDLPNVKSKAVGFDLKHPIENYVSQVSPSQSPQDDAGASSTSEASAKIPSPQGSPAVAPRASSSDKEIPEKPATSEAPSAQPPPLPELPVKIPVSPASACKHVIEEADDKKYSATKLGHKSFKGLTVQQFFALTFGNPNFSNQQVAKFDYTEWNCPAWAMSETNCCISRLVSYRMPLNASIGPKSTRVDSYQNARLKSPKHLLIESSNISKDVPFGDAFEVHEKWVVIQDGEGPSSTLNIDVTVGLIWKKAAWGLKGTINQKSIEGATGSYEFASVLMDKIIGAYLSASSAGASTPASPVVAPSEDRKRSKSKAKEEEDSVSSSDEEKKTSKDKKKKKVTRKSSKENAQALNVEQEEIGSKVSSSEFGFSPQVKAILLFLFTVIVLAALSTVFLTLGSMTSRLHQLEKPNQNWPIGSKSEVIHLRERVAFLEHLTIALLHNISHPGTFLTQEFKYWNAMTDFQKLLKDSSNLMSTFADTVGTATKSVGNVDHQNTGENEEESKQKFDGHLNAANLITALKTLPIDRKVLAYLMDPTSFKEHLEQRVPEMDLSEYETETQTQVSSTTSWWPIYVALFICLLVIVIFVASKVFGFKTI